MDDIFIVVIGVGTLRHREREREGERERVIMSVEKQWEGERGKKGFQGKKKKKDDDDGRMKGK